MNKFLIAFFALASCALAQTYRTVTADTNNVIRTNFTIAGGQVVGLSVAASNITGVLGISQGGVGATSAATALVNLLPSYTGNSNAVLALNSNATTVIWSTNAGGSGVGINTRVSTNGGVNLATVLNTTNFSTNNVGRGFAAGNGAWITDAKGVAIGYFADAAGAGSAIGQQTIAYSGGGAVGDGAQVLSDTPSTLGLGGGAVGYIAEATTGGAVGQRAETTTGGAVGERAYAPNGFAGGAFATANVTNAVQLGTGTNNTVGSIQFLSAGIVDTNEWARIAALSTYPTTNISVTGTNNTNTLVFSNGILVEVQ